MNEPSKAQDCTGLVGFLAGGKSTEEKRVSGFWLSSLPADLPQCAFAIYFEKRVKAMARGSNGFGN